MSDFHNRSQSSARRSDYVWQYEYYDDEEPVSFEGLKAHRCKMNPAADITLSPPFGLTSSLTCMQCACKPSLCVRKQGLTTSRTVDSYWFVTPGTFFYYSHYLSLELRGTN